LGYDEIEVHDGHVTLSEADILTIEANIIDSSMKEQSLPTALSKEAIEMLELLEATEDEGLIKVPLENINELELRPDWTNQVFKCGFLRPVNNCIEFSKSEFLHFTKIHS